MNTCHYNHIPLILLAALLLVALSACKGDETPDLIRVYGMEDSDILTLSPNSPALIADGTSELTLSADFYYRTPLTGDSLFRLPTDRIDPEKILITSSDGKSFTAAETYTCDDPSLRDVTFTATSGSLTSAPVTVRLRAPEPVPSVRRDIPVSIVILTSETTESFTKELTDEYLSQVLDEVNHIFDGTADPTSPTHADVGVRYRLEKVSRETISRKDETGGDYGGQYVLDQYCESHGIRERAADMLYIIVSQRYFIEDGSKLPSYTYGDPTALPGLDPTHIDNAVDIDSPSSSDYCINIAISELRRDGAKRAGATLASLMGRYYGLLSPRFDPRDAAYDDIGDVDYCPDTYNVNRVYNSIERVTIAAPGERPMYYRPFHLMEDFGPLSVVTQDQAHRIRVAMRDLPYRRQGTTTNETAR